MTARVLGWAAEGNSKQGTYCYIFAIITGDCGDRFVVGYTKSFGLK
jgi:hypothetical protein